MARRTRNRLFTILLLSLFSIGAFCESANNLLRRSAAPKAIPVPEPKQISKFQELLNSIEPSSLHNILHKHLKEKYQHGVYQEDKQAMEMVYSHDAEAATSLVELAKRQANGTSTAPSVQQPTTSSTQLPNSAQPPATTAKEPPTSGSPPSTTPTTSPPATQQSSTTTQAPSSPTTTPGSTSTKPTTEKQSSTKSTTNQSTSQVTSSNNQQTIPSRDGSNPNSETTPTLSPSSVTQQVVYKTTLANGAQTTITSITVVPAQADGTSGTATRTSRGAAGLQTGAATKERSGFNAALLGALGMAAAVAM